MARARQRDLQAERAEPIARAIVPFARTTLAAGLGGAARRTARVPRQRRSTAVPGKPDFGMNRLAAARRQGSEHKHRRAHRAHELVRSERCRDPRRAQLDSQPLVNGDRHAELRMNHLRGDFAQRN